ncbi:MAG: hypothetical protein V3U02_09895 [Calditrichia bacterium]
MEGNSNSLSENKEENKPENIKIARTNKTSFLLIGIVIGLVIGLAIRPYITELTNPSEDPIYQHYDEFSWSDSSTIYRNEELKVEITVNYYPNGNDYDARWVNITGDDYGLYNWWNPSSLYERILVYEEELSENQVKWFEYMLKYIVR